MKVFPLASISLVTVLYYQGHPYKGCSLLAVQLSLSCHKPWDLLSARPPSPPICQPEDCLPLFYDISVVLPYSIFSCAKLQKMNELHEYLNNNLVIWLVFIWLFGVNSFGSLAPLFFYHSFNPSRVTRDCPLSQHAHV